MAQRMINGNIVLPYSSNLPSELGAARTFGVLCRSAGLGRGIGEDVYKMEMVAGNQQLVFTLNSTAITNGDLLVKLRNVSLGTTSSNAVRLQVGRVQGGGDNYATVDYSNVLGRAVTYRTAAGSFNSNTFFPTIRATNKPHFMRLNWTASTLRARGWNADEAEPSSWPINLSGQTIDSGPPLITFLTNRQMIDFHWAALSDDSSDPAYSTAVPANDTTTYLGATRTIAFKVESGGSAVEGATVRLYTQQTGVLLGTKVSDADGSVSFDVTTNAVCYAIVTPADDSEAFSYNHLVSS